MLSVIEKDILTVVEGMVVHQVNCRGKMGTGLASSIREKYPIVYTEYLKKYNEYINSGETVPILGTIQIIPVTEKLRIVNAFTQFNYGYDNIRYTDYDAIEKAFTKIKMINIRKIPIYIPYKYGCGYGNGDFRQVCKIIERVCPETIICNLNTK